MDVNCGLLSYCVDGCGNFGATNRSDLQQSACPEILITNYHHTTPHIITQKMFRSQIHTICLFSPISAHIKLFSFPNTHSSTLAIFTVNNNSNSHSQFLPSVNQCSTVMLCTAVSVTVWCILLSALQQTVRIAADCVKWNGMERTEFVDSRG